MKDFDDFLRQQERDAAKAAHVSTTKRERPTPKFYGREPETAYDRLHTEWPDSAWDPEKQ